MFLFPGEKVQYTKTRTRDGTDPATGKSPNWYLLFLREPQKRGEKNTDFLIGVGAVARSTIMLRYFHLL